MHRPIPRAFSLFRILSIPSFSFVRLFSFPFRATPLPSSCPFHSASLAVQQVIFFQRVSLILLVPFAFLILPSFLFLPSHQQHLSQLYSFYYFSFHSPFHSLYLTTSVSLHATVYPWRLYNIPFLSLSLSLSLCIISLFASPLLLSFEHRLKHWRQWI